ncbi:MAG TPA: divalent metal cation transporter [Solirubrobacteraceae bacterium]|jgi:Mn2+/Fe2+ NRAMP family transporter
MSRRAASLLKIDSRPVPDFLGVGAGAALGLAGIPVQLSVAIAALGIWLISVRGSYRSAERIFIWFTISFFAYPIAAILAHPHWSAVGRAVVVMISTFVAIIPGVPVISLLVGVQVVNGILLPINLFFIWRLSHSAQVMGEHRSRGLLNRMAGVPSRSPRPCRWRLS